MSARPLHALVARMSRFARPVARWLCPKQFGTRGAAMLEFAIVAAPFFLLLFGVLELGLIFVAYFCLSNATLQVARQVRVGQVVLPGSSVSSPTGTQMGLTAFKAAICQNVLVLNNSTCLNQIQVDVRTQTAFQGQTTPTPIASGNFNTNGFCFYSGAPGSIVTMHVYLLWPITTPMLLGALANATSVTTANGTASGSYFVMTSSEVFKNEPNATSSNTGNGC